jgi:ribosomal protein S18 acetylase RimI-like enzyme
MGYDIRRIRADEWPEYRTLRLEALQDTPLAFVESYAVAVGRDDEYWRDRAERGAGSATTATFVASADGALVGKTSCFVETEITACVSAHVVSVYVTPAWRGTGVADALFDAAVGWARDEARADRIRLFVLQSNHRAAAFYRRFGFVATGVTEPYPPNPSMLENEMVYCPQ